jgi:hypothetical protein
MALSTQQQNLLYLLNTARDDLLAGRPAQRTAYALEQALRVAEFDDMDRGADDQAWRVKRGIG